MSLVTVCSWIPIHKHLSDICCKRCGSLSNQHKKNGTLLKLVSSDYFLLYCCAMLPYQSFEQEYHLLKALTCPE